MRCVIVHALMSPDEWLQKAAHEDAQALQLAAEGRIADAVLASVRAQRFREAAEEMRRALTGGPSRRTVRTVETPVDTSGQPSIAKRAASRSRRKHEAQALLYNAGVTIQALADALGEQRSRVSHWMAAPRPEKNFPRPVPRALAEKMAAGIRIKKADGKVVTVVIPSSVWGSIAP